MSRGVPSRRGLRWRALRDQLRELVRPIFVYWLFVAAMFGAFSVAALIDSPGAESLMFLGVLGIVTASSVFFGQVLALLRVRDWVLLLAWAFTWTVGLTLGIIGGAVVAGVLPFLGLLVFAFVFFGPMFTTGGVWSLRTGRAIFSAWVPLIYATGATIIMAERQGRVATWMEGSKWAIWDAFTFGVLALAIVLMLAFLVARESHRLFLWRRSPTGLLAGSVREHGAARPRLSCLGWLMLAVLAGGLAVGTALLAPYLWRTGPGDDGDGGGSQPSEQGDPTDGRPGHGQDQARRPQPCTGDPVECMQQRAGEALQDAGQNVKPAVRQGIDIVTTLLTLLVMFLLMWLLGWRPVKRLLLVRHLRRPLWRTSPTARIEQGWRLVEIAMGDVGVPPRVNEPAVGLYHRALPVLERISPSGAEVHGLRDAAAVRDRIAFGLGVGPGDVALMEHAADWAFDTVWDRLGDKGQLKAMYRGL